MNYTNSEHIVKGGFHIYLFSWQLTPSTIIMYMPIHVCMHICTDTFHSSTHTGWGDCPPHCSSPWTWACSWTTAWSKRESRYARWGKHAAWDKNWYL